MTESASGFRNQQLASAELPDFSEVSLEAPAASYVTYSLVLFGGLVSLPAVVVAGVAAGVVFAPAIGFWVAAGVLALGGGLTAYGYAYARRFGWAVRDHDLITRRGVVWRKTVVLPLVRVQHAEVASGPLQRAFGLVRLQLFSAGSGSADLVVYGLEPDRAQRVRGHLVERVGEVTADVDAPAHG